MKRKSERKDFSGEAKLRLLSEDDEFSVTIIDISVLGVRVIIAGRIIGISTPVEIKMLIRERNIQCRGRIAWALPLRPSLGDIILFDAGIEFTEINPEDQVFLEKLCGS